MSKVVPISPWLPIPLDELTLGRRVAMFVDEGDTGQIGVINGRSSLGVLFLDDYDGEEWNIPEQDIEDGTIRLYQRDES